jgi:general nucleoside transport system permease protein
VSRIEVFVAETLRMAVPYVACGLGAVISERAGVINVAFEGTLVVSGLASAIAAIATGSASAGLLSGILVGAAFCALHGALVTRARVDMIVSGIALNIIAFGAARVALRVLYDSASNSPRVPGFGGPFAKLEGASPLFQVILEPVALIVFLVVLLSSPLLERTRFGLRVRAVGETPEAAVAVGVPALRVKLAAAALSGAIAGLGGAHLVLDEHHFDAGMSGGRGFIALAAVILGAWKPLPVSFACLGFAALEATQIALQDVLPVPPELIQLIPYLATLVALAAVAHRAKRVNSGPEAFNSDR